VDGWPAVCFIRHMSLSAEGGRWAITFDEEHWEGDFPTAERALQHLERSMKPQQPRQGPPTDKLLREMSGHVSYEFQMLALVGSEPIDRRLNPNPVIQFALIESFLIHARQVHQFLAWSTSGKPNDVLAVDYLPEWSQERTAPSALPKGLLNDVSVRRCPPHPPPHRTARVPGLGGECRVVARGPPLP
jgi:hypothetical protein